MTEAPDRAPWPFIQGRCPACGGASLFVASGGYVTCSRLDCPEPDAASTLLEKQAAPALPLMQCPTCGPHATEPHPHWPGVDRCANCKAHAPGPVRAASPASLIEVRDPCPHCGDHQMVPRRQMAEHLSQLHPDAPAPLRRVPRLEGPVTEGPCLFCQLDDPAANRIMLENATCYARYDNHPAAPGHVQILPKRHVESFFDLTPDEAADAHALLHAARQIIDAEHRPDGYTIGINDGRAAGRSIDHVHIHLIPRHHGDVPDPRGGIRRGLPNGDPDRWGSPAPVCSGTDGFCDVHDFHRHAPAPDGLRDRVAEALMAWAERNNAPQYAAMRRPDTVRQNAYSRTDAVLAVRDEELQRLRADLAAETKLRKERTELYELWRHKANDQARETQRLLTLLGDAVGWIHEGELRERIVVALNPPHPFTCPDLPPEPTAR